ncbi:MAG: DNA starvation/stationary phase protection protein [Lachnospiraceae bacterium]|nr:DNA starvation/stationary phase protection protein [Lachnospiraceae bacterium]
MKKELSTKMNSYLANIAVEYVKLHNLHWNVVGGQFKAVHEYLETLYDALSDVLDTTAEALKMNGEMPLASMKDYLAAATVKELDSAEMNVKQVLEITLADMELLKQQAEDIRREAADEDNYSISNLMESNLENYAKTIWFLNSMLK